MKATRRIDPKDPYSPDGEARMADIGTTRMSLIYDAPHIATGVAAADKDALFRFLADSLARADGLDASELLRGLLEREAMMSTLVSPGIALPHARLEGLGKSTGFLAVIPGGCDYGEGIVKLAFMTADDDADASGHLGILRQFALLARNPRFSEKLLEAADPAEIAVLIERFERTL
jgi:PTS system nitrogen regulatory IIA component